MKDYIIELVPELFRVTAKSKDDALGQVREIVSEAALSHDLTLVIREELNEAEVYN